MIQLHRTLQSEKGAMLEIKRDQMSYNNKLNEYTVHLTNFPTDSALQFTVKKPDFNRFQ